MAARRKLIGDRMIELRRGRTKIPLRLRVFAPTRSRRDWACSIDLTVRGNPIAKPRTAFGVDALQALQLVLVIARGDISRFMRATSTSVHEISVSDLPTLVSLAGVKRKALTAAEVDV